VTDFIRHVSTSYSLDIWNHTDLSTLLENACIGKFVGHSNQWESSEVVRQLIERGFVVDCIYDRDGYLLQDVSSYDLIIDEWTNLPRWAELSPGARKWFYAVTAHWQFWNSAELQRLRWIFDRRNADLPPSRQMPALTGPGISDVTTYVGSDFILNTFGKYRPSMQRLQVSSATEVPFCKPKDWPRAKRRFLFFGSSGWVHRGLDLVLEAFLHPEMTECELFICGSDREFLKVYGYELELNPNIKYLGFVYPKTREFDELMETTCAVVYPSAAEGCSTSIVQCMQYGLIPIVTQAVGLDDQPGWPPLSGSSDTELINQIIRRCKEISQMTEHTLEETSHLCWQYAKQNHSRKAYSHSLSLALDRLLS